MTQLTVGRVGLYAFLLITAAFFLAPLYVMLTTSLKSMAEIRTGNILGLPLAPSFDAWVAAWLPGTEGDGVADVLFGSFHPTGRLSHSWPADDNSANIMCGMSGGYAGKTCSGGYKPLFALGFGLTY